MALPANIDPAAHLLTCEVLLEPSIAVQRAGNQMVEAGGWFLLAQFTEHDGRFRCRNKDRDGGQRPFQTKMRMPATLRMSR